MGVIEFQMKTHFREDITSQFSGLNLCKIHTRLPTVWKIVHGRRKEIAYVFQCDHANCSLITSSHLDVVPLWNKFNPKNETLVTNQYCNSKKPI